ncbi:hypothetical protein [uncultured Campylobacter sp.]|uniref:hypothetical protein n=1 Tax=uncultured Campylobacter sp. TaxID=218934 RepID=UPI00262D689B|nr:hypothetical protein [uncultured Campylobacter sp.]
MFYHGAEFKILKFCRARVIATMACEILKFRHHKSNFIKREILNLKTSIEFIKSNFKISLLGYGSGGANFALAR